MFFLPIIVSLFALVFVYFLLYEFKKAPLGSGRQCEICFSIREGAILFLKKQYQTIGIVIVLFLIFLIFFSPKTALGFLIGIFLSAFVGLLALLICPEANLKVMERAKEGLKNAFDFSFKVGAIIGLGTVGLGLLSISLFYFFTKDLLGLLALAFGSSFLSLFSRMSGGIYEKVSELWRKVEKEIFKEDSQNLPVIAQEVGKNIGDGVGRVMDLLGTYVMTIVVVMILGSLLFPNLKVVIFFPLILTGVAILAKILSIFFVRLPVSKIEEGEKVGEEEKRNIIFTLLKGLFFAGIVSGLGFLVIVVKMAPILKLSEISLPLSVLGGLLLAFFGFLITNYFLFKKNNSPGLLITIGLVLLMSLGVLVSFWAGGLYAFAITLISLLSLMGIVITLGFYEFLVRSTSTIANTTGFLEENRKVKNVLEILESIPKRTTESYTFLSTGLLLLLLFFLYTQQTRTPFSLENPLVLIGLFIGGIIVYYFVVLLITALNKIAKKVIEETIARDRVPDYVNKTVENVIEETKKEFSKIEELKGPPIKPDYRKYGEVMATTILKEIRFFILLPIVVPILVGYFLGIEILAGLLVGALFVGIFLAISLTFGGVLGNNTKKEEVEEDLGEKRKFSGEIAEIREILGNLNKNYLGLAINSFVKVLNIVALLIVRFLV